MGDKQGKKRENVISKSKGSVRGGYYENIEELKQVVIEDKDTREEESIQSTQSIQSTHSTPSIQSTQKESAKKGLAKGWVRATLIIREDYLEKIKDLAWWERKQLKELVDEIIGSYLKDKKIKARAKE